MFGRPAQALGQIGQGAKETVPELVEALKDEDKSVTRCAAYALEIIGPPAKAAVPSLEELLKKEKDKTVRQVVAAALKEIQKKGK